MSVYHDVSVYHNGFSKSKVCHSFRLRMSAIMFSYLDHSGPQTLVLESNNTWNRLEAGKKSSEHGREKISVQHSICPLYP